MKNKDQSNKSGDKFQQQKNKFQLKENIDFAWAGWPEQYPVPMFTWDELNEIIDENNGKIPDDMWKERLKRKK